MKIRPAQRTCSGFTLIELVISASLTALILVSGYLCLSSGLASQKLIEARTEAAQSARVALALMSADLRAACPLSKEIQFLGMNRALGGMEADNLDFATHHYVPRRIREADFCQVSYFPAKDPETGQYSLWRRRNPVIGIDPLSGGDREEIIRGLRAIKFEYFDGFDWYDEWGDPDGRGKKQSSWRQQYNLTGLPEAVRITLWLGPSARLSASASEDEDAGEPPVVFQTVARLNLAALSQSSASEEGDNAENTSEAAQPPARETP